MIQRISSFAIDVGSLWISQIISLGSATLSDITVSSWFANGWLYPTFLGALLLEFSLPTQGLSLLILNLL